MTFIKILLFFEILAIIVLFIILHWTNKNKSVSLLDKIFIFVFIFLLFVPTLKIDLSEFNQKENRTNTEFSISNLSKFIDERFFLRDILIDTNCYILYKTAIRYPHIKIGRIIDKKNKFLNRYGYVPIYQEQYSRNEYLRFAVRIKYNLIHFNKFCQDNSIKLYVLILPEKESVYHPSVIINDKDNKALEFVNDVKSSDVNIIFPVNELKKQTSENYMYYKTDHHLTNDGYYIAYTELMKEIQKDFNNIKAIDKNNFNKNKDKLVKLHKSSPRTGSLCNLLNLSDNICSLHLDTDYTYLEHKDSKNLAHRNFYHKFIRSENFYYPKAPDIRLMIIGNSNVEDMCLFLPYSFKNVRKIRVNGPSGIKLEEQYMILKNYKRDILKYKPDIIVLCIGYDNIKELSKLVVE